MKEKIKIILGVIGVIAFWVFIGLVIFRGLNYDSLKTAFFLYFTITYCLWIGKWSN